ncbi:hypothetical protein T4C_4783, partial [Trichinella pseudospiralis]
LFYIPQLATFSKYEEGRQEKVKSRSITNDKKMNIHMPSINV